MKSIFILVVVACTQLVATSPLPMDSPDSCYDFTVTPGASLMRNSQGTTARGSKLRKIANNIRLMCRLMSCRSSDSMTGQLSPKEVRNYKSRPNDVTEMLLTFDQHMSTDRRSNEVGSLSRRPKLYLSMEDCAFQFGETSYGNNDNSMVTSCDPLFEGEEVQDFSFPVLEGHVTNLTPAFGSPISDVVTAPSGDILVPAVPSSTTAPSQYDLDKADNDGLPAELIVYAEELLQSEYTAVARVSIDAAIDDVRARLAEIPLKSEADRKKACNLNNALDSLSRKVHGQASASLGTSQASGSHTRGSHVALLDTNKGSK
ncbi:hypothetical protein SeMB42_g02529 [Synchytrium endobioticum]|uniref:Uncharacterized protein n=1 Tax=Synchytrium endobioticum TaxID=286115 RepID=A0A507DD95_9FUNG|nr:hypothetical protein SeLEV6574_g04466 [Synchytrium endobioticum]TPX49652.1 hypothetical protein SeMB42_g02529 [Synchytrium endobioticum]